MLLSGCCLFLQGSAILDKSMLLCRRYSTATYTFSPGTVFGDHVHACQKKDAILSGKFLFRMGKEEVWRIFIFSFSHPGDQLRGG